MSSDSASCIILQGIMELKCDSTSSWKPMIFAFKRSSEHVDAHFSLEYFEVKPDEGIILNSHFINASNREQLCSAKSNGIIPINSNSVIQSHKPDASGRHIFQIKLHGPGTYSGRSFLLGCPNAQVKDSWLNTLRKHRARHSTLLSGVLEKRGRWHTAWRRRLLVLTRGPPHALSYYAAADSSLLRPENTVQPYECVFRGSVAVGPGAAINLGPAGSSGAQFEVVPAAGPDNQPGRVLSLRAPSASVRDRWVAALRELADTPTPLPSTGADAVAQRKRRRTDEHCGGDAAAEGRRRSNRTEVGCRLRAKDEAAAAATPLPSPHLRSLSCALVGGDDALRLTCTPPRAARKPPPLPSPHGLLSSRAGVAEDSLRL